MGNRKLTTFHQRNKQNIPLQKHCQKTTQRGKLSIHSRNCKNGNQSFFIVFQSQSSPTSKVIMWRKGQFQITDMKDSQLAKSTKTHEIGDFSEKEIIDAIKWSSTGAFASQNTGSSSEWCQSVCWKLGKKVSLV